MGSSSQHSQTRVVRHPKQRGPPVDGVPSRTKVMVTNLPYVFTEAELMRLFAAYEPASAKIALHPIPRYMVKKLEARTEPRRSRGFGFVTLGSEHLQRRAICEMDGVDIEGRKIVVIVAIDSPSGEQRTGKVETEPFESFAEAVYKSAAVGTETVKNEAQDHTGGSFDTETLDDLGNVMKVKREESVPTPGFTNLQNYHEEAEVTKIKTENAQTVSSKAATRIKRPIPETCVSVDGNPPKLEPCGPHLSPTPHSCDTVQIVKVIESVDV